MHEIGIVQNLIASAAQAAGSREIKHIHVALGELSDVTRESLDFYFEQLRTGTPAAGANLVVRMDAARVRCLSCGAEDTGAEDTGAEDTGAEDTGAEIAGGGARWECPACHSPRLMILSGDRLRLEAVDVADGSEAG